MLRLTPRNPGVDSSRRSDAAADWWSLCAAVLVTVVFGLALPHEPDRVTVSIENPTDHLLYIKASTPHDDTTSLVTIVGPRSTKVMPDVIDRGPSWVLHLRTLGAPAGTIEVSRTDLVNGSVVIPIAINDQLAAAGVPADIDGPATLP